MKTRRSRNETAVQGTNDSSIVSKHSMVARGYFNDPYLGEVVRQPCRRAPLINRGYYIRSVAIDNVYKTFLQQFRDQACQIVCLGVGYDTAFYRLFSAGLLGNCHYFEVDFDCVLEHKQVLIDASPLLSGCVAEAAKSQGCRYSLVACDLKAPENLKGLFEKAGVNWSSPTLLLSECVLTYLTPKHSGNVINWAAQHFEHALLAVYEQTHPFDPFGQVMLQHFRKLGSPIEVACSTQALHVQRFLSSGWSSSCCHTALDCYRVLVNQAERERIAALEPFDEFEEWHLKAQHYVLACATKGSCVAVKCFQPACDRQATPAAESCSHGQYDSRSVQCCPIALRPSAADSNPATGCCVERFAHASSLLCDGQQLLLFGGFGAVESQAHQRISTVNLLPLSTCSDGNNASSLLSMGREQVMCMEGPVPRDGMFMRVVELSPTELLLFSARSSPMKASADVHRLRVSASTASACVPTPNSGCCTASALSTPMLSQGTAVDSPQSACMPEAGHATGQVQSPKPAAATMTHSTCKQPLHLTSTPLQCQGDSPCPRWRHTTTLCSVNGKHTVVHFGGRTQQDMALSDIHALDVDTETWTKLASAGGVCPSARHSHCTANWTDSVLVVSGGVSATEQLSQDAYWIMDVSPTQVKCSELTFSPPLSPRYAHTSHVVGDTLILVGGVLEHAVQPSIVIADLRKRAWQLIMLEVSPQRPLLLHNHSSHIIQQQQATHQALHTTILLVGGGGNCFSFGTHFNSGPYLADLPMLQLL